MNKYGKFVGLFREFYNEDNIKIDEKLSGYVNFKVGGPADILLIPESKEQIKKSICICKLLMKVEINLIKEDTIHENDISAQEKTAL